MIMTKWEENNTRQGPYATSLQNFSTANSSKPTDVLKEVFLAMNAKHARYSQYLTQIWEGCRQQAGLLEISEGLLLKQTIPLDLPPRAPTPALAAAPPALSPNRVFSPTPANGPPPYSPSPLQPASTTPATLSLIHI